MKHIQIYEDFNWEKDYVLIKSLNTALDFPYYVIKVIKYDGQYLYYDKYSYMYKDELQEIEISEESKIKINFMVVISQSNSEKFLIKKLKLMYTQQKFNI